MPAEKANGIILRKYLLRETSFILVVFTKEFGKIKGVLKGIRKPYPQFAGDLEIFTYVELLFYQGKKKPLGLISQCEGLDSFISIRKDIERLTYANYYIELVEIVCGDLDPNPKLFDLLLDGLKMLSSGASAKRVTRIFEIKLLTFLGISPQLTECVKCGTRDNLGHKFDIKSGGIVCSNCSRNISGLFGISKGTQNFIGKIQQSNIEKTYMVKVSSEVGIEVEKLLKRFIQYYIGRPIKSLKFLKTMEKHHVI